MINNCQEINEISYNQLNSITRLLNLEFYEKDGNIFILNPNNGYTTPLEKNNTFVFTTEINNQVVKVEFDNSYVNINMDNKSIFMDETSLFYANKEEDNIEYLNLEYNKMYCFEKQKNNISNKINIEINNNQYNKMIKEIRINENSGIINEKIEFKEEPYTIAKHYIHRYDSNEKMTSGTLYQDDIYIPINTFIEDEINNNSIINEIVTNVENTIPGIIDYNKKLFPFLNKTKNNFTK